MTDDLVERVARDVAQKLPGAWDVPYLEMIIKAVLAELRPGKYIGNDLWVVKEPLADGIHKIFMAKAREDMRERAAQHVRDMGGFSLDPDTAKAVANEISALPVEGEDD